MKTAFKTLVIASILFVASFASADVTVYVKRAGNSIGESYFDVYYPINSWVVSKAASDRLRIRGLEMAKKLGCAQHGFVGEIKMVYSQLVSRPDLSATGAMLVNTYKVNCQSGYDVIYENTIDVTK